MKSGPQINSKLANVFIALLFSSLIVGCASVDITKTSSGFYDRTDANTVEILKTRPTREYEELGVLTVSGFSSTDTAKMHNAIRAKASALGANAVILTEEGLVPRSFGYDRWATGVAIRYKTEQQ